MMAFSINLKISSNNTLFTKQKALGFFNSTSCKRHYIIVF